MTDLITIQKTVHYSMSSINIKIMLTKLLWFLSLKVKTGYQRIHFTYNVRELHAFNHYVLHWTLFGKHAGSSQALISDFIKHNACVLQSEYSVLEGQDRKVEGQGEGGLTVYRW